MPQPYAIVPIKIGSPYIVHKYDDIDDIVYFHGVEIGRISKRKAAYSIDNKFAPRKFLWKHYAAQYIAEQHKKK